jgi:two-component system, OmpR family, sensor histidine kinase KdpD
MVVDRVRPDPDALLAHVQAEAQQRARGSLKIFLGYVAGVGKTYAMLDAAHQGKAEGIDVVVGFVETHGRAETEALLGQLEVIPRRFIEHRGMMLEEMDIDAVLARRPALVLVDELAHTNVPGSRHPKRYQDVEELLAAGIGVYTTLNIQHLESMKDIVAQVTGVVVRETVPDRIIDEATEIKLIDLPPDDLLQRLDEGKVYVPEQAAQALRKFFRKGNLTALRGIALRRTAERVDDQMRAYMETRAIPGPWPAAERLLVCISSNPLSERLVRTGRRLADELNAEWFVLHVEGVDPDRLSPIQREQVARTLQLAESLGAHTRAVPGQSMAHTVLEFSRKHNITKIIVGKPVRAAWVELLRGSVVDQLIRNCGSIDIYVMSGSGDDTAARPWRSWLSLSVRWRAFLQSIALVALATLINVPISRVISPVNLVMPYLTAVVIAAVYVGRGPAIFAAVLSVLCFDYFFVPPHLTFSVSDTEYLLTFLGLFVVGVVISTLAARVRKQAETAEIREAQTAALYAFSRDLASALSLEQIVRTIAVHLCQNFGREAVVLLPRGESLELAGTGEDPAPEGDGADDPLHCGALAGRTLDENEMAVAAWAFQHGQPAGRGTDTLPASSRGYLPLKTVRAVVGVLGVRPPDPSGHLTPEQWRLMEVFASQAALAIERNQLADQARQAQLLQAAERLQTALLNSISHDLRTPLVSITGALSSLSEDPVELDEETRNSLIDTARGEAERLNQLVGNLLDMTRIDSGAMTIRRESYEVQDVIGSALDRLGARLGGRPVNLDVSPDLPLAPMDFVLMVQVLINLLDNAVKYSSEGSPIDVQARATGDSVELSVADRGVGIPPEDLTHVFDKFYRVQRPGNVGGTGLGLSICKGIVEAHGGQIRAENRPGGGTVIRLTLPLRQEEIALMEERHE